MSEVLISAAERAEGQPAWPLHALRKSELEPFLARRPARARALVELADFKARTGQVCVLSKPDGRIERALLGLGEDARAVGEAVSLDVDHRKEWLLT